MKIYTSYILAIFICAGICWSNIQAVNIKDNDTNHNDTSGIRFDGLYNTFDTSMLHCGKRAYEQYTTSNSIVFLMNNNMFHNSRLVSYGMPSVYNESIERRGSKSIGKYKIIGDSIYATIPTQFARANERVIFKDANYSGYIKNKDTILGWRIVPPYPDIKLKYNRNFAYDTMPKMIYFIKYDKVRELERFVTN